MYPNCAIEQSMAQPKNIILLFLLLIIGKQQTFSNQLPYNFKAINTTSSLPTNEVRNLYQDSEGFIWISTYNGLVRYDGYSTIVYKPDVKDSGKSLDGFVNIVVEDNQHQLWIGTHNGLYVLDKKIDRIEKIVSPVLQSSYIEAIVCATNGDLWVGANKGLYCKKSGEKNFKMQDPLGLDIKSIIEDKRGNIWIGTWERGLFRYDPETEQFYAYKGLNPSESAHILFQDKDENIWVGTWRYGLMKIVNPYDVNHYSFERFVHEEGDSNSLADNIIYAITQDRNSGKIWIGSRSGLSVLESEENGGTFTNYLPGDKSGDLPFNEVDALLCSRDGLMWVGMLGGGIYTVNTRKPPFTHDTLPALMKSYPTSSVRSIFQCEDGKLWMGIMGFGLILYDPQTQVVTSYHNLPMFKHLPYISTVNDIIFSKKRKEYCFATWDDGIWLFDGKEVTVVNTETNPELTDICIYSLLEDSTGNLWIGSRSGLFMLDTSGQLRALENLVSNKKQELPQSSIFKIVEDKNGDIWATTVTAGIWKISPSDGRYKVKQYGVSQQSSSSMGAMALCVDSYNRIWAGTNGNGLDLYDKEKDCFVSVLDEYFKDGDVVFSMLEDNQKTLWLTTNSGLYHIDIPIDGSSPVIHTHTVEDGLQGHNFNRNAAAKGVDGILIFGGVHGLNVFDPKDIVYDKTSYPVVITDLKIYNTSIRKIQGKEYDKILDKPLDYADHITLAYNQNNFSLDFSILNYINPLLNKYEYQLVGYDDAWVSTNAYRHFAYYNNLPAGNYEFKVRGANANGIWSSDIRTIKITILPPPWLCWWAYCIYFLLIFALLWYLYRTVRNRINMKHTIELGNIQRQKLEEINHAKLQFFTNITHELLTPLSIISASVEELKQQSPDLKGRLRGISENTIRLIRLIQQILEFRKVENGCQKLRVSQGNITLFLKQSISAFTPLVRQKKLNIRFEGGEREYNGYFDSDKLDKIVYNLLSNAAKYTHEGGVITVSQSYDETSGIYRFCINNPGELIPKEKIEHFFERFYEGEYRKFHTIGTGIGLSLVKDLILLHHGSVQVVSEKEKGNSFIVEFPILASAYPKEETDHTTQDVNYAVLPLEEEVEEFPDIETTDKAPDTVTLLLVEDNDELLTLMVRLLQNRYHILKAANGIEALDILSREEVDLIVSDVMMPQMDGMELCQKVKGTFETCHIPFILLTAMTYDEDRAEGYKSGADGYICKPLRLSVLLAKIENLLEKRKRIGVDFRKQLVFEAKELNYTSMDEAFIQKAIDCVNAHLSDCEFEHAQFIAEMGMARTTLADKLKLLTGLTPSIFICNVRLQAACRLIDEKKKIRVADLAYAVGFNDPKYFSSCFKKKFGLTPTEYMMSDDYRK